MFKLTGNGLLILSLAIITTIPILVFTNSPNYAARAKHQCTKDARIQAKKLLSFFSEGDSRVSIDEEVKVLPPIQNPANKKMMFDVLEVGGYIYKARYRMRLLYLQLNSSPSECALVGEEVLNLPTN